MKEYLDLLEDLVNNGTLKSNRTGIDTLSLFGRQLRFDLSKGFPLVTTKKVNFKHIAIELIWILSGSTNIKFLVDNGTNIWSEWCFENYLKRNDLKEKYKRYSDEWKECLRDFNRAIKENDLFAAEYGNLKGIYGKQWSNWECKDGKTINQITEAIDLIKNDPNSRRIVVSAWNVDDVHQSLKDPNAAPIGCHTVFQFYVNNGKLSCHLYQRSGDYYLGISYNIASYSLLTHMIAQVCGLEVGDFIHSFGDVHLYVNHIEQAKLQLTRKPMELSTLRLNPSIKDIFSFKYEDIELLDYQSHPAIKAEVSV